MPEGRETHASDELDDDDDEGEDKDNDNDEDELEDELDEAVRCIDGAAGALRTACRAAQSQVRQLQTELAASQRALRRASEQAAALTEELLHKASALDKARDAHAAAVADAAAACIRAAELEQQNADLQRVSRVVALQNENARLREEIVRLTTQPPAPPRRRAVAVATSATAHKKDSS